MTIISSMESLEALYGGTGEASLIKETGALTPSYRQIIEAARFCVLATSGPEGLDASPRGDDGPVVRLKDDRTLLMPDRRGNNRIDSLRNIVRDPRVSVMFMITGWNNVLRVNGKAVISAEPDLLASFEKEGKRPRSVTIITIDSVYFQCARAILRADLWNLSDKAAASCLPSTGSMLQEIKTSFDGKSYDDEWPDRAAKSMW